MSTIDEIIAEKNAAVAILDQKILEAGEHRLNGEAGMDDVLTQLEAQRAAVFAQALKQALDSEELKAALAAMKRATADMKDVADNMKTAAKFISKVADLGAKANVAVSVLKNGAARLQG